MKLSLSLLTALFLALPGLVQAAVGQPDVVKELA
jgi:hypothetical protein